MSAKTILGVLLAASLAGNAAFLLTAFFGRPSHHDSALEALSLTPDQQSRFEASKQAFMAERKKAHEKMGGLREGLADEFAKDGPDRERLLGAAIDMAKVQTDMRPKLVGHLLGLHAILTPEQRSRLAAIMRGGAGPEGGCPGAVLYANPDSPSDGER